MARLSAPHILFALAILSACGDARAQLWRLGRTREQPLKSSPVNWVTANNGLSAELDSRDIGVLATQAVKEPVPNSPGLWLRCLALLVRAEYRQDALHMLLVRPKSLSRDIDWQVRELTREDLQHNDTEMARRVCEQFPEELYAPGEIDRVVRSLTPAAAADAWLVRRGSVGERQWIAARLRMRARAGTVAQLLAAYEQRVRRHPADLAIAGDYFWAVRATEVKQPIAWISTVCRPNLAIQSLVLGQELPPWGDPIPLFLRSLCTPFTANDNPWYQDYVRRMQFSYIGPGFGINEADLRTQTKQALMAAYQKSGQAARAQALLEELTAANPNGLPLVDGAFQAGEIQRTSGSRVIEQRVLAAADMSANQNSPSYWLARAEYYSARHEDQPAVDAFSKALSLSPLPTDSAPSDRIQIVLAYERHLWLQEVNHPVAAMALLHHELERANLGSEYADNLASVMVGLETDDSHLLVPDDNLLWAFIAVKPQWVQCRQLLQRVITDTPPEEREKLWSRAEALAKLAPGGRAYTLGEMMVLYNKATGAIPWLEQAAVSSSDEYQRSEALSKLWDAYRATDNWRDMQKLTVQSSVEGRMYFNTETRRLELAIAAAKSGARAEAMGFFRNWANQDRRLAPAFYPLPSYGLLADLKLYYHQLQVEEPRCATPERVQRETGI